LPQIKSYVEFSNEEVFVLGIGMVRKATVQR